MGPGMEGWIRSSFFSDLVWGVHARTSIETTRHTRETRAVVSPLQSRAWSFALLARFARQTDQQSGISLNLRTGPNGHATLFNQVEGVLVFIKTLTKWSKIFSQQRTLRSYKTGMVLPINFYRTRIKEPVIITRIKSSSNLLILLVCFFVFFRVDLTHLVLSLLVVVPAMF